ncbi:MAG: hypothetical protein ACLRJV_16510, partial [Eubacteriales bacterium]
LICLHPPYHNPIPYSGNMWGTPHKDDLSRCSSYPEFVEKLNYIVQKLFMALRRDGRLAILVGDIRTKGSFYSMQHDLMRVGQMEAFIVKGQYNCVSDTRSYKKPFIPVVTEYLLLFHKQDALFPFRGAPGDHRGSTEGGHPWLDLAPPDSVDHGGAERPRQLSDLGDRLATHQKQRKTRIFGIAYGPPPMSTGTIYFLRKRLLCLNMPWPKSNRRRDLNEDHKKRRCILNAADMQKDFAQIQKPQKRQNNLRDGRRPYYQR